MLLMQINNHITACSLKGLMCKVTYGQCILLLLIISVYDSEIVNNLLSELDKMYNFSYENSTVKTLLALKPAQVQLACCEKSFCIIYKDVTHCICKI